MKKNIEKNTSTKSLFERPSARFIQKYNVKSDNYTLQYCALRLNARFIYVHKLLIIFSSTLRNKNWNVFTFVGLSIEQSDYMPTITNDSLAH